MRSITAGLLTVVVGSVLAGAATSFAADSVDSQVDSYVESQRVEQRIPGLALLVVREGQVVKSRGYGLANLEYEVPVTERTIFQSGSVGKQFTAAGVMLLVEDGKLALDDPVSKFLKRTPESWQNITVRHLLSHTAGLGDYPPTFDLRRDYTEDALLNAIYAAPLKFKPGESWAYSNLGYATLGILIHKAAGKPYGEFLTERVFRPLGMSSTRIINEADIIPQRAAGYRLVDGQWKNQEWVSPTMNTTADGSLYFNLVDLVQWDAALRDERLLKRASLEAMWTPALLPNGKPNSANYGFGWMNAQVNGHRLVEHGGAWQGFTTYIGRYVDDGLSVIVLTNLSAGDSNPTRIARHVAGLYVPEVMPSTKPLADQEPEVTSRLRELVARTADGQANEEDFDDEARSALFPARIKALAARLAKLGKIESFLLVERAERGAERVYRYRVTFADDRVMSFTFRLTKADKIGGLQVERD